MIHVEQLTKTFGAQTVVNDVNFTLEPHTATALIGPNGAGKTTTLSMLTGLLSPTSGKIIMPGVTDIRKEIGFLPQYPQFYPWLTALEFTEMAAVLSGLPKKQAKKEAQRVLEFVGLAEAMHKKTATFSGGMKQRLGMAQAIVHKPKLLLLDEPVSALDPVGRREIMELLKQLQEQTTILYSTHILNDAEEMTDQVLFLRGGQLVEQGNLREVHAKYAEPRYLIEFVEQAHAQKFASAWPTAEWKNHIVRLPITEGQPTMTQLLRTLANSPYTVVKVEQEAASLEEIFMKVVER